MSFFFGMVYNSYLYKYLELVVAWTDLPQMDT